MRAGIVPVFLAYEKNKEAAKMKFNFLKWKKPVFSGLCILLAASTVALGADSYAKYANVFQENAQAGVSGLACSVETKSVSSLSFTNADYWLNEDKTMVMNVVRNTSFVVKNTENGKTSSVPMEYELVFYAPQAFATNIALQLLDETGEAAILPQITVADLLQTGTYTTANATGYQSVTTCADGSTVQDCTFNVQRLGEVYSASSEWNGEPLTITVEPEEKTLKETLHFRLRDVSAYTTAENPTVTEGELGRLLSPLVMEYTATVPCYRIAFRLPSCKLSAGTAIEHGYSFNIILVEGLGTDDVLEGTLVADWGTPTAAKGVYGGMGEITVGTTTLAPEKIYYDEVGLNTEAVRHEFTAEKPFTIYDGTKQIYYVSACYSKTYPCSVSAKFTQLSWN